MRKYILLCCLSAALGSMLTKVASQQDPTPVVSAQETPLTRIGNRIGDVTLDRGRRTGVLTAPGQLTPEEQVNIAVYESVNRSVVNINTEAVRYDSFFPLEMRSEGLGSGSILDREGHILTNYHVVEDARQIEVTLASGKPYTASLVGHDAINDIAVLKIDAPSSQLNPVTLGESASLRVGQRIYVIGSPFELERTFTTGIISSLNRTLPSRNPRRIMNSIIQVDAAMNPGNSGGPLLDTGGRVIGMNTAIKSKTGQNTGVGFAIPVDRIRRVIPDLIRYGKVSRPNIGIISVYQTEHGLLIRNLEPGGPAERAGLKGFRVTRQRQGFFIIDRADPSTADMIIAVNHQPVQSADDFLSRIEAKKPGDQVVLTIVRGGRQMDLTVRLEANQ